ncbi:MAG: D-glycero-beta-D-manno-heptose-7-phosphate kinase [Desulfovibrio sp.]|jgi:D-beta-D-heptose 7-phosphate kinase/D-beta-D-heptose 1-phosphate adenosyltransferase|nr:D-glycero-beta-D-manno-heptose-7-phosphate kinase [Desulfovibrio sp.]
MNFCGARILVVGDVMLDNYIVCRVNRISPEAPVPVAHVRERWSVPGGAANVARNLARLTAEALLVGLVGRDEAGRELRGLLEKEKIGDGLVFSGARATIRKTRIMAQGQQLLRFDEEEIAPPTPEEYGRLSEKVREYLPGCKAVILSDYGKGALSAMPEGRSLCAFVISRARGHNIPVLVDPKGVDWGRYAGAQCVTPNSAEFAAVCGLSFEDDRARREKQAMSLCGRFAFERLLVTRGPKGMALFEGGGEPYYIRDAAREVADVSGAGDTAIAALGACVATGFGWRESARIANAAAGIAVGKAGTAPVSLAELSQALHENAQNPKLHTLDALRDRVEEWRRGGESVIFTNGCFDLLHPGHVSLIRQCVALGDRLVVALNSDASVRRLKGASRPVQDEQSRALLIAALRGVDAVILFDGDTPLALIEALRPDVLVKGADYTEQTVVGADAVKAYGGRVHLARLAEGCSTTNLVRRMGGV